MPTANPFDINTPKAPGILSAVNAPAVTAEQGQAFESKMDPATHTVQGQLAGILASGSPLLVQAQTRAAQDANARGLLNSSMAVGAGESALYGAATPIATSDAGFYNTASLANADRAQSNEQANVAARNRANEFNTAESNTTSRFNAGEGNTLERTKLTEAGQTQRQGMGDAAALQRTQLSEAGATGRSAASDAAAFARTQLTEAGQTTRSAAEQAAAMERTRLSEEAATGRTTITDTGATTRSAAENAAALERARLSEAGATTRAEADAAAALERAKLADAGATTRSTADNAAAMERLAVTNAAKLSELTLDATTRQALADTEANYRTLMQASQSAGDLYSNTLKNINDITMNKDLDAAAKNLAIAQQQAILTNGMELLGSMNNLDIAGLVNFSTPETAPAPATTDTTVATGPVMTDVGQYGNGSEGGGMGDGGGTGVG
jgi:hypothetical protein